MSQPMKSAWPLVVKDNTLLIDRITDATQNGRPSIEEMRIPTHTTAMSKW